LIHGRRSKRNIETFVSRRQEANTTLYTSVQLQEDILNHLLDILSSERSSTLISDHQNIYKSLILNNSVEHVRSNILHALDQQIMLLFQKGVLTFETLSSLDRKKAEEDNTAGVYLHVIYELEQPSIYWLYVGAAIDVQSRVEEHKRFRRIPSRDSLHSRIWNQEGRGDFFILFGGFSNIHVPEQDQVAMINLLKNFGRQVFQTLPKNMLQKAFP